MVQSVFDCILAVFRFFRIIFFIAWYWKILASFRGAYEGGTSAELISTQAWRTVFLPLVMIGGSALLLRGQLPRLRNMSEDDQILVALMVTYMCVPFVKMDSIIPLVILASVAITTIDILTTTFDIDNSGITEGILLGFSKMCWFFMFESKIWQSVICGVVLISAIASRKGETIMPQSVHTTNVFQVILFLAVFGGILALICCGAYEGETSAQIMSMQAWRTVLIALVTVGGSTLYIKLLRWLLPRLQNRRFDYWFVAVLVQSTCDPFVGKERIMPLAVLSAIAMMTIGILATTVDNNSSTGVTDGILFGFGKMLWVFMKESKIWQSAICGIVLISATALRFWRRGFAF